MFDISIGEFCPFVYGKALKAEDRKNGKIPVYGSNGIVGYHNEYLVNGPGIIIGRKGSVGELHLSESPFWVIDTAFYISGFSINELRYIYYQLKTLNLDKMNSDSAVPGLNRENAHNRVLSIPEDSNVREKIGGEIAKYDNKLKCNNRINQTLETIAQTLFKSWFVDFDPVKAKIAAKEQGEDPQLAAMMTISGKTADEIRQMPADKRKELADTADLFPDEMLESELGWIPKGWKVQSLKELVNIKYGKDHKKLLEGKIPVFGSGGIMRYADQFLYANESVLIPRKGSLNNVMYVDEPFWTVDTMFYTVMKRPSIAKFVYQFVKTLDLSSMNVGSVVPSMTVEILNAIPIVIPSEKSIKDFDQIISSLYNTKKVYECQNKVLSSLRDSLLPQLLSGEIAIN
ncbi:restriction endonuclease subunit S [Microbacter margulisiae]|uniref:Type I restriction enzyme S subunit n=1 Tax=Microbacter margulisiae TaxID=1350067 RepID=A0A7W5DS55_9PORP|nr:restriction endonuclease subunit S [Microbacter margulisiae]MBB3187800.1 type I restriction enzyme S subunit [Microbacter margulisiae]